MIVYIKNCMLASSKSIHCFSSLSRKLDVGSSTRSFLCDLNYNTAHRCKEAISFWGGGGGGDELVVLYGGLGACAQEKNLEF